MRLTNYSHVLSEGEEFGDNWDCGAQDQNGKKTRAKKVFVSRNQEFGLDLLSVRYFA